MRLWHRHRWVAWVQVISLWPVEYGTAARRCVVCGKVRRGAP